MKLKLSIVIMLFASIILKGQSKFLYDFSVLSGIPIIEGKTVVDKLDTCYLVNRSSAEKYDNFSFGANFSVKYRLMERFKIGLSSQLDYTKNEPFNITQTPIYRNVWVISARLLSELDLFRSKFGDFSLRSEIGYAFKNNILFEDVIEEQGGVVAKGELNYYFVNKLKGLFLGFGYEWSKDKVLWDIYKVFGWSKPSCPTYSYQANKHYLVFRLGLTL